MFKHESWWILDDSIPPAHGTMLPLAVAQLTDKWRFFFLYTGRLAGSEELCRTCFFNTPLYLDTNPGDDLPDYVDCPCCVLEVYDRESAANEDGPRCKSLNAVFVSV